MSDNNSADPVTIGIAMGKDIQKPVPFLPPNANVSEIVSVNQMLYAATTNTCAGVP